MNEADSDGEQADNWLKDRENIAQLMVSYQLGSGNLNKEAQEAWRQIVERHEKWLLHFTRGQIYKNFSSLNINLAEEIRNDAFCKLHIALKSKHSIDQLGSWFKTVIVNLLHDRIRKKEHLFVSSIVDDEIETKDLEFDQLNWHDASNDIDCKKFEECKNQALQKFSQCFPKFYQVIVMIAVDELSNSELSERLGRSYAATKELVSQCRKKFRPFLTPCLRYSKFYSMESK